MNRLKLTSEQVKMLQEYKDKSIKVTKKQYDLIQEYLTSLEEDGEFKPVQFPQFKGMGMEGNDDPYIESELLMVWGSHDSVETACKIYAERGCQPPHDEEAQAEGLTGFVLYQNLEHGGRQGEYFFTFIDPNKKLELNEFGSNRKYVGEASEICGKYCGNVEEESKFTSPAHKLNRSFGKEITNTKLEGVKPIIEEDDSMDDVMRLSLRDFGKLVFSILKFLMNNQGGWGTVKKVWGEFADMMEKENIVIEDESGIMVPNFKRLHQNVKDLYDSFHNDYSSVEMTDEASNAPMGADTDALNPDLKEPDIKTKKQVASSPAKLVSITNDNYVAIFKLDNKLYAFNVGDKDEYTNYSDITRTSYGPDDYDLGEWDLTAGAIQDFVNDNLDTLTRGYGYNDFERQNADLVEIDKELAMDLISTFEELKPLFTNSINERVVAATEVLKKKKNGEWKQVKKSTAGYKEGTDTRNCSLCKFFSSDNKCSVVFGAVDKAMVCESFAKKGNASETTSCAGGASGQFTTKLGGDNGNTIRNKAWYPSGQIVQEISEGMKKKVKITEKQKEMLDEMDYADAGGGSGTFAYDAHAGDGNEDFWFAGNKENRKRVKLTKEQVGMVQEYAKKAYKDGKYVEFDDCTKLDNNKKAQGGGCSVGAKDNVVQYGDDVEVQKDLFEVVAKETGRSIDEVKSILENYLKEIDFQTIKKAAVKMYTKMKGDEDRAEYKRAYQLIKQGLKGFIGLDLLGGKVVDIGFSHMSRAYDINPKQREKLISDLQALDREKDLRFDYDNKNDAALIQIYNDRFGETLETGAPDHNLYTLIINFKKEDGGESTHELHYDERSDKWDNEAVKTRKDAVILFKFTKTVNPDTHYTPQQFKIEQYT